MRVLLFLLWTFLAFSGEIRVFAAADLQHPLSEIVRLYERRHPQDKVVLTFGSSGKGATQIRQGAPFDIYMAANMKFVEDLYKEGYVVTPPKPYAVGKLVIWVRKDSGLDPSKFPQVLLDDRVKKIAIADWKVAPYGAAAKELLERTGLWDRVKEKLVIGENISQTASFVFSGAADVGLISLSQALSKELSAKGIYWVVPKDKYTPIVQGYGITKRGSEKPEVRRFYEFILSKEAREVFKKYGFDEPY
ncbi:molybdenum ABC transporter, periplasmic molybdate-binding protein [Thermocrinis albus DSM 14484]|uniref:Molybdenum ABC transporter, periplasmic molybdate-binding protein n=1 Tax=Thermocrinis albus (strain DSM 14484 / JCM 11386 / HI 11/12) TaxID=638303 RepID=D3SNC0_THEAH|nr:molybdate ABC transporter substrate-binding protein [Thermocrinis albus]ADC88657.1 molybdenum ABC transporter, periplasmic molybdate-binding protein [Thermocrinis albus DSM 14484]